MFHAGNDDHQLQPMDGDESHGAMPMLSALNGTESSEEDELLGLDDTAESKRLAVQSALLVAIVVLIAGGVLFGMRFTQGGANAEAATEDLAKIQTFIQKSQNPDLVSKEDPQHPDKLRLMSQGADQLVQQIATDYAEKAVPIEEVAKNPFALAGQKKVATEVSADFLEGQRREQLHMLRSEFDRLNLQSVMGSGARSVAVIDGEFYRRGARLGSFKVAGIQPGRVGLIPVGFEMKPGDPRFILEIQAEASATPRF